MRCPACNIDLSEGSTVCADCGKPSARACPACKHLNPLQAKFCSECGASLCAAAPDAAAVPAPASHSSSTVERRQLTIMFCDLVGSTARSTQLDPEDLREVISAYHKCVAEIVDRYRGFVAQYLGDGALVYFGYPQAHEDDAECAVRAALAVVDAVPRVATHGEKLQARIGIATGSVVVGEIVGVGKDKGAIGETPNLAARLQGLAEPNSVVIAAGTRDITCGLFEYCDLGHHQLKGFSQPVRAWQVMRTGTTASRFEALRSGNRPIVGRDEEIDLLFCSWHQTKSGQGRIVLLSGEPGIGKSRITAALEDELKGEPHIRLRYFCSPQHQDSPLHPFISQIDHAAGFERDDSPQQKLDKLRALLAQSTSPEDVALIADLLAIPGSDSHAISKLAPQQRRQRVLAALAAQLASLAAREPVLIVFEDLHWIDPTSLEMLDRVVDAAEHHPILLVATARPEYAPRWSGRPHVIIHPLDRLSRDHGATIILQIAGGDRPLAREVAEQILDRTDGIPLFVEELTKVVLEAEPRTGASDLPGAASAIPNTLHASLMARLDRLSPIRDVVHIGAALGREFSYELISAVHQGSSDGLQDALRQLVAAELLSQRGTPPHAVYGFKHALVQDVAYGTLVRDQRKALHARVAASLNDKFPTTVQQQPEILAHHYAEAGLVEAAIDSWFNAGRRDLARSAYAEAVRHLSHGIALLESLPSTAERARREREFHVALGPAMISVKGFASPETMRVYARASELLGDSGAMAEQLTVRAGLWTVHQGRVEHLQARGVAQDCLTFATRERNVGALALANKLLGQTHCMMGEFAEARQHLEQTLALSRSGGSAAPNHGPDDVATAQSFLARALFALGYLDQAAAVSAEALAHARRAGPMTSAVVLFGEALLAALGDPKRGAAATDQFVDFCVEHKIGGFEHRARFYQGALLAQEGELERGIEAMRVAVKKIASPVYRPLEFGLLAEAHGRLRQFQAALTLLTDAVEIVERTSERFFEAELYRLRGVIFLGMDQNAEAASAFQHAITVARRQQARLWELRASIALAMRWQSEGRHCDARNLLSPVCAWFSEGFHFHELRNAKALLASLCGETT